MLRLVTIGSLIGKQQATNNYSDYGMVTRFLDSNPGKIAIVAAGVGRGGTIAAGEFLIDPAPPGQVVHRVHASPGKKNKKLRNMEFVLNSEIIDSQAGTRKLAHPRWQPARSGSVPQGSPLSLVWPLGPPARCGLVSSHKIHQFSEVLRLLAETPPVIETVTGAIREYVPDHNLLVRIEQQFNFLITHDRERRHRLSTDAAEGLKASHFSSPVPGAGEPLTSCAASILASRPSLRT